MSDLQHPAPEALSLRTVDTYEKLDILLFVRECGRPVVLKDIAVASAMTLADAKHAVGAMCSVGLLSLRCDGYICAPVETAIGASIDALARAYRDRPMSVLARVGKALVLRKSTGRAEVSHERAMERVAWRRRRW